MRTATRVDYDAIAHLYDAQPYRRKGVDPELIRFLEQRPDGGPPAILDIACGTGSQLVANRETVLDAYLVGIDRSQGDAGLLPFPAASFDFIACQFGFHHVPDKAGMLREVFRTLRGGGRFTMRNLCPHEHPDWLYYDYFPEAQTIDLVDFWPPATIVAAMAASGFVAIAAEPEHLRFEQDLRGWLDMVRRRDLNSQLMAISDAAYAAGVSRLERELTDKGGARRRPDHLCLITICGDKRP